MRALYERYVGYLTAVCSRYVPDRAAVKDILQDAFISIITRIEDFEFRGEGSLRARPHRPETRPNPSAPSWSLKGHVTPIRLRLLPM